MNTVSRTVCVITGTRADYGHLYWILRTIQEQPELLLQLVVTAAHLSPEFAKTRHLIEQDGFPIAGEVEMLLSSDSATGIAKSIGLATIGFADLFARLQPDLLVLLGDRYEMLAAAQAALPARIPVAHIHGGETSQGAMDEAIRHALTKLSHLHLTACEPYRRRVIQLGEAPERVFNCGAPGLDHLTRTPLPDRDAWQRETGFTLQKQNIIVTYHPTTLDHGDPETAVAALLQALDAFPECGVLFTSSNADTHGRIINQRLQEYVARHPERTAFRATLGMRLYLGALRCMDLMVGNSSSGIIEAPACRLPSVNMGSRQQGRLRAPSIIDCPEQAAAIQQGIALALTPDFRAALATMIPPYGEGDAAQRIVAVLRDTPLEGIVHKVFYDLP